MVDEFGTKLQTEMLLFLEPNFPASGEDAAAAAKDRILLRQRVANASQVQTEPVVKNCQTRIFISTVHWTLTLSPLAYSAVQNASRQPRYICMELLSSGSHAPESC